MANNNAGIGDWELGIGEKKERKIFSPGRTDQWMMFLAIHNGKIKGIKPFTRSIMPVYRMYMRARRDLAPFVNKSFGGRFEWYLFSFFSHAKSWKCCRRRSYAPGFVNAIGIAGRRTTTFFILHFSFLIAHFPIPHSPSHY